MTDIRQLADDIDRAWAEHDLNQILALHDPSGTFQIVGESPVYEGLEALRAAFSATLTARPDLRFDRHRVITSDDTLVVEGTMYAGEQSGSGTATVQRPCVDVYTVRDGRVLSKRTYLAPNQLA